MNYLDHYNRLIDRARGRKISGYSETHHVIPKCMGGGNEKSNLVELTAEEHFVAHQLLVKIYPGNVKLVYSAWAMSNGQNPSRANKQYGWMRRAFAEAHRIAMTGRTVSDEWKSKISAATKGENNPMFGKPVSDEVRWKLSKAGKGRKVSEETRKKMGEWQKGKKKSLESIEKMRKSQIGLQAGEKNGFFGKKHSEETKAKMRLAKEKRRAIAQHSAG